MQTNDNIIVKKSPLATALITGVVLVACALAVKAQNLKVGDPAPQLQVSRWVQGEPVMEFARDKVYLVEFWATWCQPCIESMPHLNKIANKFEDKGLVVIGQNVFERNEKLVETFRDKMSYRIALDDKSKFADGAMAKTWLAAAGQTGIPCSFLVGKDGRIAWIGHPRNLTDAMIEEVLAGTFDSSKSNAATDNIEASLRKILKTQYEKLIGLQQQFDEDLRQKKWEQAEATASKILDLTSEVLGKESNDLVILKSDFQVKILVAKGDTNAALEEAQRTWKIYGNSRDPQLFWNMASELLKDPAPSRDALEFAEGICNLFDNILQKNQVQVFSNLACLARISFINGNKDKAIDLQQKAIDVQKKYVNPEVLEKFGEEAYSKNVANQKLLQSALESYKAEQLPDWTDFNR